MITFVEIHESPAVEKVVVVPDWAAKSSNSSETTAESDPQAQQRTALEVVSGLSIFFIGFALIVRDYQVVG
jgi:hypothetical protein